MSIAVNLYYTGKNGNARKFAEEMESSGTADRIRAEDGNERYEYFYPKNDPETVLLIDMWRDQEAIDAHHAYFRKRPCLPQREIIFISFHNSFHNFYKLYGISVEIPDNE